MRKVWIVKQTKILIKFKLVFNKQVNQSEYKSKNGTPMFIVKLNLNLKNGCNIEQRKKF